MPDPDVVEHLRREFTPLDPLISARVRRPWAAAEALEIGRGGVSAVITAAGLSHHTVAPGIRELRQGVPPATPDVPRGRVRRPGGGRKPVTEHDASVVGDLESLVAPVTRGDPPSPRRWTCKGTRKLAEQLRQQGHSVGSRTVAGLRRQRNYSPPSDRKTRGGASHPDRDAQFEHIDAPGCRSQRRGQPVVSVDPKEKELVGEFKDGGREYQPRGRPEEVRVHDFEDKGRGTAIPYGVSDLTANEGWVSVGIDHDTASFAAATRRRWGSTMGSKVYPKAQELLVTADAGGSDGSRIRPWKVAVQEGADATGRRVKVGHFPPGTSEWAKIEHRMFCPITEDWRGRPLRSLGVIVNLIGGPTTKAGLRIRAELDPNSDETGLKVSDEQLATVRIKRDEFHGEWNYTISPRGR